MKPVSECPLTPALCRLLQTCLDTHSINTGALARALYQSPETVHSNFKLIGCTLETRSRFEAVLLGLRQGWLTLPPAPDDD